MIIKGKTHKYFDNVDTDVIIPARYLNSSDAENLKAHCMEDIDKDFVNTVEEGDVIVAGENFGCGSSREHAPLAIKYSGVKLVIAKSFARIFYRNAINIGLPILECSNLPDETDNNDIISCDLSQGIIKNITKNKEYRAEAFPLFITKIIDKGGLINFAKGEK